MDSFRSTYFGFREIKKKMRSGGVSTSETLTTLNAPPLVRDVNGRSMAAKKNRVYLGYLRIFRPPPGTNESELRRLARFHRNLPERLPA